MHCHLIVSQKDQAGKKKLSPLTNHKNTKHGLIKGGFDRVNMFQQVEQGFDKLFGYNRQQIDSFDYHNTMKNGSTFKQLSLQKQILHSSERTIKINQGDNLKDNQILTSSLSLPSSESSYTTNFEAQMSKPKKIKKRWFIKS